DEFQAFFKQIRGFLTVQEQVDLFSRWAEGGSEASDFLATIALTASGFAQRKPERIAAARERLVASGRSGIEPLLANLHLLLGEVDDALALFSAGAGDDLRAWAEGQSEDPLGQLCAYCRDWLSRDVLPGYRDLESDPDLDAYFADRDVIAWVEREDRRSGRHYSVSALPPLSPVEGTAESTGTAGAPAGGGFEWGSLPGGAAWAEGAPGSGVDGFDPEDDEDDGDVPPPQWRLPLPWRRVEGDEGSGEQPGADLLRRLGALRPGSLPPPLRWIGTAGLALMAAVVVIQLRPQPTRPPARGVVTLPVQPAPRVPVAAPARPPADRSLSPLTAKEPNEAQLRQLLESWLAAKGAVLAGGALPADLSVIARASMVDRLKQERSQDVAAGESQAIEVSIASLRIRERLGARIAVEATLAYSDQRRDSAGKVVERTPATTLRNVYVFGRDDGRWRLAASRSAG
ncbi:MAG: IMS domain-containing protein, partial [Cyanobium sp.]